VYHVKTKSILIVGLIMMLWLTIPATATVQYSGFKIPTISNGMNKITVIDKMNSLKENKIFSSFPNNYGKSLVKADSAGNIVTYSNVISSYDYCYSCSGIGQSTVINHYSSVPTYYPDQVQPTERGYGSMVVTGPDNGKPYYFWIKSDFFALDVEDYYDMQWIGPSTLPAYFNKNILSGSYCLKVTASRSSPYKDVVWCGTAIVATNQTTTVKVIVSGCPFGCSCC